VLGARWLSVVPLLWILCPVGLIQSIVTTIGQIYTAKGETGLMFLWGIGATTIFVLSFLVGALWGVQGVAIAYAMANVLLLYPALAIPFRLIGLRVRDLARSLAPVLLITLSMMAVTSAWLAVCSRFGIFHHPAVVLATSVAIGVFVYGTLVWALLPDLLSEVAQSARAVGAVRVANLLEARRRGRVAGLWRSAATGEK
jgi:PST family polysaccharide transporter